MKTYLLQFSAALLVVTTLHAQNFNTDVNVISPSTAVPNLKVQGNGGVLFKGNGNAIGTIPALGAGNRLMWYPAKNAFRAGIVNGAQWDDANVGVSSAAFGVNNQVSGTGGFAAGSDNNVGSGWWSAAFGGSNLLNDTTSTLVTGNSNLTNGVYCGLVAGSWNSATKSIAVAIGEGNTSTGWGAMTLGRGLVSASAGCVAVGMYNQPIIGNDTSWIGSDPVFIVGNGTGNTAQAGQSGPVTSNALVVYKNGDIQLGKLQGDISGGEFAP